MANLNPSDMYARKVFQSLLRTGGIQLRNANVSGEMAAGPNHPVISLAQLARLSTYDKPAAPTIEQNEYYDKYREKLEKIRYTHPEKYKAALESIYGEKSEKSDSSPQASTSSDIKGSSMMERMKSTSKPDTDSTPAGAKAAGRKGLDDIVKLELLADKSVAEITQIWAQYYATKEGTIYATIPVEKYARLKAKGKECPLFIYALPRDSGYEFVLGQCNNDDWYYTPLLAYQTHGEFAPFSLSINFYTELADDKSVVLMRGEIASQDLPAELATLLVHQTQLMYGSDENFELVQNMHKKPDEFKHMEIIDICKKAGLF